VNGLITTIYYFLDARLAIALTVFGFGGFLPLRIWLTLRGLGMYYFRFLIILRAVALMLRG
jgi:hypothetical protein